MWLGKLSLLNSACHPWLQRAIIAPLSLYGRRLELGAWWCAVCAVWCWLLDARLKECLECQVRHRPKIARETSLGHGEWRRAVTPGRRRDREPCRVTSFVCKVNGPGRVNGDRIRSCWINQLNDEVGRGGAKQQNEIDTGRDQAKAYSGPREGKNGQTGDERETRPKQAMMR